MSSPSRCLRSGPGEIRGPRDLGRLPHVRRPSRQLSIPLLVAALLAWVCVRPDVAVAAPPVSSEAHGPAPAPNDAALSQAPVARPVDLARLPPRGRARAEAQQGAA